MKIDRNNLVLAWALRHGKTYPKDEADLNYHSKKYQAYLRHRRRIAWTVTILSGILIAGINYHQREHVNYGEAFIFWVICIVMGWVMPSSQNDAFDSVKLFNYHWSRLMEISEDMDEDENPHQYLLRKGNEAAELQRLNPVDGDIARNGFSEVHSILYDAFGLGEKGWGSYLPDPKNIGEWCDPPTA